MSGPTEMKWWQCLLVGAGFFALAVFAGPVADRYRYATFAGLLVSIAAFITSTVFWVIGFMRLVKRIWSLGRCPFTGPPNQSDKGAEDILTGTSQTSNSRS